MKILNTGVKWLSIILIGFIITYVFLEMWLERVDDINSGKITVVSESEMSERK